MYRLYYIVHVFLFTVLSVFIVGCEEKDSVSKIDVELVSISHSSAELEVGESLLLTAIVLPSDAASHKMTWSSSNTKVASVSESGLVNAISKGSTTITVKVGEKTASCLVTVFVSVSSVALDKESVDIERGNSITLNASVYPEDASDKSVIWTSSNSNVATVEDGVVAAVSFGETIITAKAGEKTASCKVKVFLKGQIINIDGDFSDWATITPSIVSVAKNNPDSPWNAVKEIRSYANPDFVYFYINYDSQVLKRQLVEGENLPIRICLNTDGEFTSGYQTYFLDGYDFIVEGPLADGSGAWNAFDGSLYLRANGRWSECLKPGNNLVTGKGRGTEYEIMLARDIFNNAVPAEHKFGNVFYIGIRFYCNDWRELSNMPNSSVKEGEGKGWGHLMKVMTAE